MGASQACDAVGLLAGARRVGGVGRVASEPTPADRVLEGAMEDRVDVVDRPAIEPGDRLARPPRGRRGGAASERVLRDVLGLGELGPKLLGGRAERDALGAELLRARSTTSGE